MLNAQNGLLTEQEEYGLLSENPLFNPNKIMVAGLKSLPKETISRLFKYSDDAAEKWQQANRVPKETQLQNVPLDDRARKSFLDYIRGNINQNQYINDINQFYPPSKLDNVPQLSSYEDLVYGLGKKSEEGKKIVGLGVKIDDGDRVMSRLDIPAYNNYNVWSASLKEGKSGETVYGKTVHLTDKGGKIKFQVNPNDAMRIAKGKELGGSNKYPMATIDGNWKNTSPENVQKLAEKYMNDPAWSQIGMNPRRFGYFYDKADGMPVSEADEVLQIGSLVLAKNVKKFKPEESVTNIVNPKTGGLLSF